PSRSSTTLQSARPKTTFRVASGERGPFRPEETPGRRDAGTPGRRDAGTPGRRDAGTPGRRDAGTPGRRDAGTPGRRRGGPPASILCGPVQREDLHALGAAFHAMDAVAREGASALGDLAEEVPRDEKVRAEAA